MASTTPGQDMRGIRQTKRDTYVVRACLEGVQTHVGTFRTYADALAARNRAKADGRRAAPAKHPIAKKPKANGVYERFNSHGRVYDVFKYREGHLCWGGRYQTREAAEEAAARLKRAPTKPTTTATTATTGNAATTDTGSKPRGEPGITVRFNRGRRALSAAPEAAYIARSYKAGGKYLGTFYTLEDARNAVSAEAASIAAALAA